MDKRFAYVFWLLFLATGLSLLLLAPVFDIKDERVVTEEEESESILFVGDIMLARGVERLMRNEGPSYPFQNIYELLSEYDKVVGNFEATIPEVHVPTADFTYRFSVPETFAEHIARAGLTDVTLANNHAIDYGESAYEHTRSVLENAGMRTAGHPTMISSDDVLFFSLGDVRIALLSLNTVWYELDPDVVADTINALERKSDMQLVYIHWGDEYQLLASDEQKRFARSMVNAGADVIIGHHPHVVQQIEEYKGVPIFYSLGNFIFDQYKNNDVQEGLAVGLRVKNDSLQYELIPITSAESRSSPKPMGSKERAIFLRDLAARSDRALQSDIASGVITTSVSALASL